MINFDDYTKENKIEHNSSIYIHIIHTEHLLLVFQDQEK